MKKQSNAIFWAILVVGLFICIEGLSFIMLALLPAKVDVSIYNTGATIDEKYKTILHPYAGYISKPVNRESATRVQNRIIGKKKDENTLLVLLLGGSVASQVGVSEEGRRAIIDALNSTEQFQNKNVEIVTIAAGGHKQPQQLMIVSFLLSLGADIDLIINLDGFNDVVLPIYDNRNKGVFPYYPRNWAKIADNGFDKTSIKNMAKMITLEESFHKWSAFRMPLQSLKLAQRTRLFLLSRNMNILHRSATKKRGGSGSFVTNGPYFDEVSTQEALEEAVDVWAESSRQLGHLAKANNILYYHFLQPNQYDPDGKQLNEQELKIAYFKDHAYRPYAEAGYPILRAKGKELVEAGEQFTDLTKIFNTTNETIYKDTCCHVTNRGDQLLGEAIGRAIVQDIQYSTTQ